jgi:hypothetical protein
MGRKKSEVKTVRTVVYIPENLVVPNEEIIERLRSSKAKPHYDVIDELIERTGNAEYVLSRLQTWAKAQR